jgi:hypothetical protein
VLELEMFSTLFAVLFLAALSVVTDRETERREDRAARGGQSDVIGKKKGVTGAFLLI